MGAYLISHSTTTGKPLKSMRIGSCGAGSFLVEQWIAGYAISGKADPQQARKVRLHWLEPVTRPQPARPISFHAEFSSRQGLIRALQDDSDGRGWVRGQDLDRTVMRSIRCPMLLALVELWHMAQTFWHLEPTFRVSADLLNAVEMSTLALEEITASWAGICREAADLLQDAGTGATISIG